MENEEQSKAYKRVTDYIKGEILSGILLPGQKLPPERNLAKTLSVGRNSVREALRTLDMLGVIASTQGAGNYVSCNFKKSLVETMSMMFLMQKTDYKQISQLRVALESQAIVLAVDWITPEQIRQLEETVEELSATNDEHRNVFLDKKLHYTIAQASGNTLILEILQALSDVMDIFISDLREKILTKDEDGHRLQHVHERILKSLKDKNKQEALQAIMDHFSIINEHLGEFYEENE